MIKHLGVFLKEHKVTPKRVATFAGLLIIGAVLLTFAFSLLGSSFSNFSVSSNSGISGILNRGGFYGIDSSGFAESSIEYDSYGKRGGVFSPGSPTLSIRNISPVLPPIGGTTGSDAEEFEVTEYNATIESQNTSTECNAIGALKSRPYVIFENSSVSKSSCTLTFKVAKANVDEIVTFLKTFDPKELAQNSYTIKRQVEDYTAEIDILESRLEIIQDTLRKATAAYNEITELASRTQNADALAKVIESKIQTVSRLSQEAASISEQLDRLSRTKAVELDRLDYTYFHVSVYEDKYVDSEKIKDSWKYAIKTFVDDMNRSLQNATVHLLGILASALPLVLYFFIGLFVIKYGWRAAKEIWKK